MCCLGPCCPAPFAPPTPVLAVTLKRLRSSPLRCPRAPPSQLFCRVAEESTGGSYCPILRSSLRGTLCLGGVEPWMPEPAPGPSTHYDLSRARAALFLAVIQDRPGAQHDVEALRGLCQALGFETTLRTDPTAQAFQEELAQFRERLDTRSGPVSCVLVALMAHGGPRGQLMGADWQEVHPEALQRELSHCRALRGCPKIFLLQACRGGNRDAGVRPTALPWYWRWLQAPPTIPSHADVLQIYADAQGWFCLSSRAWMWAGLVVGTVPRAFLGLSTGVLLPPPSSLC
ncbi:caspase-14-like [Lemur catta]|uniref:caspase-14-like n=1 Tax=Lemur catta TaxID=9447 RepID=UPI001E26AB1C|nr:caspase-14-like [Lemur catta]